MNHSHIMFKRLTLFTALLLVALMGYSQSTTVGFQMGINFSNLVGRDKIDDSDPRKGMCPGILLDIPLAYESFLELGAIYSQQGVVIKTDGFPKRPSERIKTTVTRYVDYINVPILWKQNFGDIYAKAGPYVSIAKKATSKMISDTLYRDKPMGHYDSSQDTTEVGEAFNQSFINKLRQYDVGASIHVGYQSSLGRSNIDIFIDASYNIGFFSVEKSPTTAHTALRNQFFSISAGFFIVNNRRSHTYRRR